MFQRDNKAGKATMVTDRQERIEINILPQFSIFLKYEPLITLDPSLMHAYIPQLSLSLSLIFVIINLREKGCGNENNNGMENKEMADTL